MENNSPRAAGKSSFDLLDPEKLFAALPIAKDSVIMDAACGIGAYTMAMAPRCPNGKIYAFDLWEEGLDRLVDKIVAAGITNVVPRVADLCALHLGNGTIDICLIATVLHDLIQEGTDYGALPEVKRVLKSGGLVAVIEFKKMSSRPGPPINIRISPSDLDELLRLHGFAPVQNREIDIGACIYLSLYTILRIGNDYVGKI